MIIILTYGMKFASPNKPTNGVTIPPNNDCTKPNRLEALPLPPVRSSIAIENPKVATPVTGATRIINPINNNQILKCIDSVMDTHATPISCTIVNILSSTKRSI